MKIAISSSGKNLEDEVSDVFARCPYFVIAEIENGKIRETKVMENKVAGQPGQAGILVAQSMAEKNIGAVITGNVGPRAMDVLRQFKIEVWCGNGTVRDVLQKFTEGKLEKIS
jgi:predicted Fe-Mo cluster-binding NifX family protein